MTKNGKMMIATFIGRFLRKMIKKKDILSKYRYNFEYWSKSGDICLYSGLLILRELSIKNGFNRKQYPWN